MGNSKSIQQKFAHDHMTTSELDQGWCVCNSCGFMTPERIFVSGIVWLPGYGPLKIKIFPELATSQILPGWVGCYGTGLETPRIC